MRDLTIVMPAFNEAATLQHAIDSVLSTDFGVASFELVIVDDGSVDATREILEAARNADPRVRTVHHERNMGKGVAIRTGLARAEGAITAIMDADLEYEPSDIIELVRPLVSGEATAVYGVRGFASHTSYSFWYVVGNKTVTLAANMMFNSWVSDIMTCHKAMHTDLFRQLDLRESGFAIEPEITARLLRRGVRIYEVPVSYTARTREEGKKLTSLDGLRVLRTLVRCRFR